MDTEALFNHQVMFTIPLGKLKVPVTDTVVVMWIIMAVIIILALVLVRPKKFEKVPKGKQLVAETVVNGIGNIIGSNMGKKYKDFVPYFGTILIFLVFANIASIFNLIPSAELMHHWTGNVYSPWLQIEPPTSDLNIPLVLSLMTVFLIPISAIKYKGIKGYGKNFLKPTPIMLPFNILDYVTRTLSLTLRLFGNVFAGVVIMDLLYAGSVFIKPIVPLASAFFDLFDAGLQAYIFVFLSSIYVGEAIQD